MTKRSPSEIGRAELKVLKALWEVGEGTVAQVRDMHRTGPGDELAYTTVMTVLGRLVEKGLVRVDRSREPFVYQAAQPQRSVLSERLKRFVESVFDGRAEDLVVHLIEDEALNEADLERIRKKLKNRKGAP